MNSSPFEGVVLDSAKCSKLSMEEKRELVYELSKWSHGAPEMLQSWTRREILQIMCAEMGKERKYTGLTKLKIIENLLKIVAEKKSQGQETEKSLDPQYSPAVEQRASKRQRKTDHPNRFPISENNVVTNNSESDISKTNYCKNSACRAKLSREDVFCKRCSCCICYQYDDNKDPSLWLTCSSEPPYQGNACGMSCHLECALRNDKSGIGKVGMDGSFCCMSCGKMNDLLGCWRKQLITAKDTRRVDILCYRVSLSQKLLMGTKYYQNLCEIVDEAVKKLEAEVGPLTGLPVKKARGIVNRLSSGPEVQRLCAHAVESLDLMLSKTACNLSSDYEIQVAESNLIASNVIQFVDVCTSSAMMILGSKDPPLGSGMGYTLWHRKAEDMDYPAEPTCTLFTPNTRFLLSGLCPATEYFVKVFCFNSTRNIGKCEAQFRSGADDDVTNSKNLAVERNESPATNSSSLSNPSSVEDETNNENGKREEAYCKNINTENFASANVSNNVVDCAGTSQGGTLGDYVPLLDEEGATEKINSILNSNELNLENNESPEDQEMSTGTGSNTHVGKSTECVPFVGNLEAELPNTPYKLENFKDGPAINGRCKPSKKDLDCGSGREEEPSGNNNRDFEYYVKVIRWLECEGHIETSFRQKFLTWYSLKATPQEVRVVKVFVDTLIDDPASLAGQLVDAFLEIISSKRPAAVPSGFCLKLWH
ncbi:VIN3-like protein [Actinidia chinensis var. chinensis]|uniref:VIN3-like protein n=1 Tax=Actinidia chinensis var. chinensis TaxID=1590841 RepID=A0A2R6Q3Q7_ACTCC|nr:VIN3-like protein [Actinidia chinensis var. chinensis]